MAYHSFADALAGKEEAHSRGLPRLCAVDGEHRLPGQKSGRPHGPDAPPGFGLQKLTEGEKKRRKRPRSDD
ncbi:hypothetical protein CE91St45_06350 [Oscillospiraceae bacterium]|nr:hypothetical protein CE91St45_06350 [Oscillospiraceae bacterium]